MTWDLWGIGVPGPGERTAMSGSSCEVCGDETAGTFEGTPVCADCLRDAHDLPPIPTQPRKLYRGLYADPHNVEQLLSQGLGRFWTDDPRYAEQFARGNGKDFARENVGQPWGPTREEFSRHRPLIVETDWGGAGHTTDLADRFRMDASEYRLDHGTPLTLTRIRQLPEQPGDQERDLLSEPRFHTAHRTAMPTWYHHTDNPDFALDPNYHPAGIKGDVDPEGDDLGPGIFLAPHPHYQGLVDPNTGEDVERPYIAEIYTGTNLRKQPGVVSPIGDFNDETYVPADQFHHLTVQQVRPRKARTMTAAVTVPVGSQHGLHTTPSMLISNAVKRTGWPVWFSDETGTRIDARDPLAVMSLGARHGAPITVHCDHPEIAAHIADYVAQDHD